MRTAPPGSNIKLSAQANPANPTMRHYLYHRTLFPIEAQFGVDWTEPGFGAWAYVDCITSHSEGGAGDDEMVPCSPLGGRTGGG